MQHQYPRTVERTKLLDTYAAEAVAAGNFYGDSVEVPRGAEDIRFSLEATVMDQTTGDEEYTFAIQGRNNPNDSWVPIPSCSFTKIDTATTGYEIVPTAANAPGVSVPRFVRAHLLTAGTSPIATAKVRMHYRLPAGPGLQYEAGYMGG